MKLSRTVTYALKATLQLAQNNQSGPVPCSRLAAQGAMPERFLLQILRSLVTHGILKSTRGVDGGYVLLKQPEDVSLLDVIEAIEGPMTHEIAIGEGLPIASRQKLSNVLEEVTDATLDKLSSIKLADLVFEPDPVTEPAETNQEAANQETATAPAPTCEAPVQDATVTSRIDGPAPAKPQIPTHVNVPTSDGLGSSTSVQPVNSNR